MSEKKFSMSDMIGAELSAKLEGIRRQSESLSHLRFNEPKPVRGILDILQDRDNLNYASEFHRQLSLRIRAFEDDLDEEHEVGVRMVNFGQNTLIHLERLTYWNPSLIIFFGRTGAGDPVELIQHVTQISVLLVKIPRLEPEKPKRKIGFQSEGDPAEQPKT